MNPSIPHWSWADEQFLRSVRVIPRDPAEDEAEAKARATASRQNAEAVWQKDRDDSIKFFRTLMVCVGLSVSVATALWIWAPIRVLWESALFCVCCYAAIWLMAAL